jgi:hypothetical protein
MPISSDAQSELQARQGGRTNGIAELRRQLARPSQLTDGHRQRLLDLATRLRRVQALGGEYRRVTLSDFAAAAMHEKAAMA